MVSHLYQTLSQLSITSQKALHRCACRHLKRKKKGGSIHQLASSLIEQASVSSSRPKPALKYHRHHAPMMLETSTSANKTMALSPASSWRRQRVSVPRISLRLWPLNAATSRVDATSCSHQTIKLTDRDSNLTS